MKKIEALHLFGGVRALADGLNITEQAVAQWGDNVPELRVYQIRCILGDKAIADKMADYRYTVSKSDVATTPDAG